MTGSAGENWLQRWREGRTGWHEADGNAALKEYWPPVGAGARVLVPLCGKTPDMRWLAGHGTRVIGIELSRIAVESFFTEQGLACRREDIGGLSWYRCEQPAIEICCGDYFGVTVAPCDAVYDRGALVAMPPAERPHYAQQTNRLLKPAATRLVITLEYDQERAPGPPYSVPAAEVLGYWPDMQPVGVRNDIDNAPPKFRAAGLTTFNEVVWRSS